MCDANFLCHANRAGVQAPVGHPQDKGPGRCWEWIKKSSMVSVEACDLRVMYRKPQKR